MPDRLPTHNALDYYLRSVVTTILALAIVGFAAYGILFDGRSTTGPFVNWAGIIVGVYFGQHATMAGVRVGRKAVLDANGIKDDSPSE